MDEAVEMAITECIEEGILAELLGKYRAEAKSVSIYKYIHIDFEETVMLSCFYNLKQLFRKGVCDEK